MLHSPCYKHQTPTDRNQFGETRKKMFCMPNILSILRSLHDWVTKKAAVEWTVDRFKTKYVLVPIFCKT